MESNSTMSVFWALVRNDLKHGRHHSRPGQTWRKFYAALAILFGVIMYTWAVLKGVIKVEFVLLYLPAFLILPIVFGWQGLKREWGSGTAGWWLALPYSRRVLLGAKATAGFLRFLRVILSLLIVIFLLALEAVLLRSDLYGNMLSEALRPAMISSLTALILSPLSLLLGITLGVLQSSKWRPALPLFWLLIIIAVNVSDNLGHSLGIWGKELNLQSYIAFSSLRPAVILYWLGVLASAAILYFFAAYVLDRHVEA